MHVVQTPQRWFYLLDGGLMLEDNLAGAIGSVLKEFDRRLCGVGEHIAVAAIVLSALGLLVAVGAVLIDCCEGQQTSVDSGSRCCRCT